MTGKVGRPSSRIINNGLAIYSYGLGEPLLLMPYPHGIGDVSGPLMQGLVRGLKGIGRQVVTFDPPQAGRSRRPARINMAEMLECAEEALTICGIEGPVDVMGHCHGGLAALALAIERPERVRSLILAGSLAAISSCRRAPGALWSPSHPLYWRWWFSMATLVLFERLAMEKLMWNVIRRASFVDQTYAVPRRVRRRDWLRRCNPRSHWLHPLALRADAPRRLDYRKRLQEVSVPTLVVVGDYDPQMPRSCSEELERGIPDARLATLERSGHFPFVEEPETFWAAIGGFLAPEQSERPAHQQTTGLSAP
jgi:pimeloyl-ACP methyl ester carboxylesterase